MEQMLQAVGKSMGEAMGRQMDFRLERTVLAMAGRCIGCEKRFRKIERLAEHYQKSGHWRSKGGAKA